MSGANHDSAVPNGTTDVQTFAHAHVRARLSPVTLSAFRTLADRWKLSNLQAAALLGVSEGTWDQIIRGTWRQSLSQDQLVRASAVVGTYKALHSLFADGMADRWPKLANKGTLFRGRTPVEAMVEGGIPAIVRIRQHVDGLQAGL